MVADLREYRSKRDFHKTPEPRGAGRRPGQPYFVVQKHAARRLHYDFRLAMDGVLKSWALTRGPSLDPTDKRLAVRTEDHPLSYTNFEGVIPEGSYGGGTVMLWDRGDARFEEDPQAGLAAGKFKFTLAGQRLIGGFALVRMRPKKGEKRENWLLIKERDRSASTRFDLERHNTSVATGRTMEEIAGDVPPRRSAKGRSSGKVGRALPAAAGGRRGRRAAVPPAFVAPQLATLVPSVPAGDDWLYEIKYDGYRVLVAAAGPTVRCYTRSGKDWTERFAPLVKSFARLDLPPCLIDGEAVVVDERGRTDFGALQAALEDTPERIVYFAFDLLSAKGKDMRALPQRRRNQQLAKLLGNTRGRIKRAESIEGDGGRIATAACRAGAEGVVAKQGQAPYRSGRTRYWLKVKCVNRQEFVIGGWSPSTTARPFSSLLLGVWEEGAFRYAGRVGSGFDNRLLADVAAKLAPFRRKTNPFDKVPAAVARNATWVTPRLVAEVRYTEMTKGGVVRHAVFDGLREDKDPAEVTRERPSEMPPRRDTREIEVARIRLTNPNRILFPSMGLTKRALAEYVEAASQAILAHLSDRPVSLVRCPEGRASQCFFQKHGGSGLPDSIEAVAIQEKSGKRRDYIRLPDTTALVACVQMNTLEFHIWGSRYDRIDRPDRLVIDLDPGDGVTFAEVRRAAVDLAGLLREAGLESFPLLTGGKGIHLVLPLERRRNWKEVGRFAHHFAAKVASLDASRFVAVSTKSRRSGRIYVDHLRNRRGATAIAPFSPRARDGAPVAAPVSWDELDSMNAASAFTVTDLKGALDERISAWRDYGTIRQSLTASGAAKLGISLDDS